jgi:cell wall assembly regulator SMI1
MIIESDDEMRAVEKLLLRITPRKVELPDGATDEELDAFVARTGIVLPESLRAWLKVCNGAPVVAGLFGVKPVKEHLDIEHIYSFCPEWRLKGWIPVSSDGCGNYFLIVPTRGQFPVVFIDTIANPDAPTYIVASDMIRFLYGLFEDALKDTGWPCDEDVVLERDPEIATFTEFRKCWDDEVSGPT